MKIVNLLCLVNVLEFFLLILAKNGFRDFLIRYLKVYENDFNMFLEADRITSSHVDPLIFLFCLH